MVEKARPISDAQEHHESVEIAISDVWAEHADYRPDSGIRSIAFLPSNTASASVLLAVSFADNRIGIVSVDQVRCLMYVWVHNSLIAFVSQMLSTW
jgi:hypothetical protein